MDFVFYNDDTIAGLIDYEPRKNEKQVNVSAAQEEVFEPTLQIIIPPILIIPPIPTNSTAQRGGCAGGSMGGYGSTSMSGYVFFGTSFYFGRFPVSWFA